MQPLVSIITINYNQAEVTCELLQTLNELTYSNYEVIIVDNASSKEDRLIIETRYPQFALIANEKNEGYTGGNNVGINAAKGDLILLLNNDTEVPPGFLEPLVDAINAKPEIGIVSPTILFHHTPGVIQYAGSTPINPYTARSSNIHFGKHESDVELHSGYTHLGHGAAMLVKREVFNEIGLLSDLFFIYYEEYDFCERAKRKGFLIRYVAESRVFHKESITTGKVSPFKTYYMTRNRLLFIRRNVRGLTYSLCLAYLLLAAVPKNNVGFLLSRRFDLLKSFWKGLLWHFKKEDIKQETLLMTSIH